MSELEEDQLLFFETFSHDNSEDLNLDLVQFKRPVVVTEIRIIPLGTCLNLNVPGNVRLGATNPSSFKLELFVHNLGRPSDSTFQKLGILEYKANVDIQLRMDSKVPTDGLIIKGWYQTITLAVYGVLTNIVQERASPPPPPPPHVRSKPLAIIPGGLDQPDMLLTQKATLERTQEWAEKAAAALQTVMKVQAHRPSTGGDVPKESQLNHSGQQPVETLHSPVSSPSGINPRDIPLEHRGGTPRDPRDLARDPREQSPQRFDREDHDPSELPSDKPMKVERHESRSSLTERELDIVRSQSRDNLGKLADSHEREWSHRERDNDKDIKGRDVSPSRESYRNRELDRDMVKRSVERSPRDLDRDRDRESGERYTLKRTENRRRSVSRSRSRSISRSPPPVQGRGARKNSQEGPMEEDTEPGEIAEMTDDIYGSIDRGSDVMEKMYSNLSDGEIQENDDNYSQISSDENNFQIGDEPTGLGGDVDWGDEDVWKYDTVASFNPYQCDLAPLETYDDPSLTPYEVEKQKLVLVKDVDLEKPEAATQLLSMIETFKHAPQHEAWIEAMERVPGLLIPGLVYLVNKTDSKDVLETLINWTFNGLDLNKAIAQPNTAYKVRHLKMGIRVAGALCSCDSFIAFQLLSREVQHRLIDLFVSPHMSSSVKLHIINALDQTTRLKEGLDWLLGRHHLQLGTGASQLKEVKAEGSVSKVADDFCEDVKPAVVDSTMAGCGQRLETDAITSTGYQRIVDIMITKQGVRPLVGLTALVRKVHVYEVLLKLMTSVDSLIDTLPSADFPSSKPAAASGLSCGEGDEAVAETTTTDVELVNSGEIVLDNAAIEEIELVVHYLNEIAKVLVNPDNALGQQRRTLPNRTRFEVTKKPFSTFGNLFHMFNACRFMESLFILLCAPATCNHSELFSSVKNILTTLLATLTGMLYLNSRVETINGILRALIQSAEFGQDEDRELNPANQLGLLMIYHLQTLQHIDQLREYGAKGSTKEVDDNEILAILHSLYSMTFSPQGRDAVVSVFTLEDNLTVLLPFVEMTGDDSRDARLRRSVCYAYANILLLLIARHSERVEWLTTYGHKLLSFVEKESSTVGKVNERVTELHDWLAPIKHTPVILPDSETVNELVKQLQSYSEEVADLPKGLVTVLRVLRYLAISPSSNEDTDHTEELKFKFVLVELYSANSMAILTTILQKVFDMLLLPWQQGYPQTTAQKTLILSMVRPTLAIMKAALSYLILARGSEFKDLSCLPCLLNIHTVLCSVSSAGVLTPDIQQIQNDIVDTLMAFTQPSLAKEESEEALNQSLWSMMVKQVLTYTLTAPYTFLSGLILLSELLPVPLPVQAKENLTNSELTEIINNRKRWSAHLHPHSSIIQNIIHSLAGSLCHPLHQVLRRVCWQLADLAMPTSLTVVRSILDTLMESLDISCEALPPYSFGAPQPDTVPSDKKRDEVAASSQTARILNLFGFLVNQTQTTVKAAFLFLSQSGSKSDEKYGTVLPRLADLLNIESEQPYHIQAQESIVGIFQSLCDMEISLVPPESGLSYLEQLANSLPNKDQLSLICHALLEHINNRDQKFSSILPSLRTVVMLMNYDYGFYYVKQAMERVPTAFFNLFMQINATFSKDSSDCIATLSSAAECIEYLVLIPCNDSAEEARCPAVGTGSVPGSAADCGPVVTEPEQSVQKQERTYKLSFAEVRKMLSWPRNGDPLMHPLNDLDVLLREYAKDEETLKAVYQSINVVVGILKAEEETTDVPEIVEIVMPAPLPLTVQFSMRTVFIITDDDDERLNNIYWLSTPMGDESDHEQDQAKVKCDFIEMSSVYCPGLDLKSELEKGSTAPDTSLMPKRKRRVGATRRSIDTINTSKMHGANGGFVAPMRGRGFGRGMNSGGRGDMFRSRPPNTSRPPSMHVDDYVKLEMQHGQSGSTAAAAVPSQAMPPPMSQPRRVEDAGHSMFDRGNRNFAGRGGHFYTPPGYGHRDSVGDGVGRGGGYRGGMILSRAGGLPSPRGMLRGTATGLPMLSRGAAIKTSPSWGGRNTRQQPYGRPAFLRSDDIPGGGASVDRLDRLRENINEPSWHLYAATSGSAPWPDHKDRQSDARFVPNLPPPGLAFSWRDGGRHQRTSTR